MCITKKFILFFILTTPMLWGQKKYPQHDFRNPLDIPMVLAGTFGELRSNHFHSGIDIKTQGATGKRIYTAKEGYVSRIKISLWGYGKALYITHPNGYTTVYAHLKNFSPKIEAYIKKQQYLKKTYTIQLFPQKTDLPILKDEIVAFSGNTGGSTAPHLHFEIRDTKTEKTINPLLFGYDVKDEIYPTIKGLRAMPQDQKACVNHIQSDQEISLTKLNSKTYKAEDITAYGKIGLSVSTHDLLNMAPNKNGIYSLKMFVNDTLHYHHNLETFAFHETKYINLLIDYPYYKTHWKKFQKTFVEPHNKLSLYKSYQNKGFVNIEDGKTYRIKFLISDIAQNSTTLTLNIQGDQTQHPILKNKPTTNCFVPRNEYKVFKKGSWEIRFPKETFYQDTHLNFTAQKHKATVHKPIVPLHKKYTLTYYTDSLAAKNKKYAYIGIQNKNGYKYISTQKKEHKMYCNTKSLGNFSVAYDSIAPVIYKASFYKNQNISSHSKLSIRIKDNETGIQKYTAYIDQKWVLMEYEPKKQKLTFDLHDLESTGKTHTFKLEVKDMLNNTKTYTSTFIK